MVKENVCVLRNVGSESTEEEKDFETAARTVRPMAIAGEDFFLDQRGAAVILLCDRYPV